MSEARKKPTAGFWITVALVAVLVGYPPSFGPACWMTDRGLIPRTVAGTVYDPLAFFLAHYCSDKICTAMYDYGTWGSKSRDGAALMILIEQVRMKMGPSKEVSRESF